jgi:hypothetical protein
LNYTTFDRDFSPTEELFSVLEEDDLEKMFLRPRESDSLAISIFLNLSVELQALLLIGFKLFSFE